MAVQDSGSQRSAPSHSPPEAAGNNCCRWSPCTAHPVRARRGTLLRQPRACRASSTGLRYTSRNIVVVPIILINPQRRAKMHASTAAQHIQSHHVTEPRVIRGGRRIMYRYIEFRLYEEEMRMYSQTLLIQTTGGGCTRFQVSCR